MSPGELRRTFLRGAGVTIAKLFVMGDVQAEEGEPPAFVKGEHAFIVSDQDEAGVLANFRRRVTGCYVGMGIVGAVACIFMAAPLYILASFDPKPVPKHAPVVARRQKHAARVRQVAPPIRQVFAGPLTPSGPRPGPEMSPPDPVAVASATPEAPAPAAPPEPAPPREVEPKKAELAFVKGIVVESQICIVSAANGRLLEANWERNNGNGSVVVLRSNEGFESPHRQWIVKGVAGAPNTYTIVNVECNRLLDGDRGTSKRDGTKVQVYGTQAGRNKERYWRFCSAGDDAFFIVNMANGRYLEADPMSLEKDATEVRLWGTTAENEPQRKWRIGRAP